MARRLILSDSVFLDTAYAIALASATDELHLEALPLAEELEASGTRLLTTWAVPLEIGNALSKVQYRHAAVQLLSSLRTDPSVEIIPLSDQLFEQALKLYSERPDKEWGLTDCVSFVVMQARSITDALTTDEPFQQAGFRVTRSHTVTESVLFGCHLSLARCHCLWPSKTAKHPPSGRRFDTSGTALVLRRTMRPVFPRPRMRRATNNERLTTKIRSKHRLRGKLR